MELKFNTFVSVKQYFNENLNHLHGDVKVINIKKENFSNLKFDKIGYKEGSDYIRYQKDSESDLEKNKWIEIRFNEKEVTLLEFGYADFWWNEV
ncbi:hypothetical protein [Virgibacillus sp. DJP39]|uniref:hypothetical protein n=1 Tax=Virgibacillus sp. DJP39 TaxID=3409790 RepID=UPI003BB5AA7A